MRNVTKSPSAPVVVRDARVVDERSYEFITPVFGGGVRVEGPRKHRDPVTPVRAASLRGQLRFWWRAVNPRGCRTVAELSKAEAEVFGAASSSSERVLDIAVVEAPRGYREVGVMLPKDKFKALEGMEDIAYGAFPLRDPDAIQHGVLHEHAGTWRVVFRYGELVQQDVTAALWAWAHFGGLGGRTRRGFGAVRQVSAGLPSIEEGFARWIAKDNRPEDVPWPALRADRARWIATTPQVFTSGLDAQKHLLRELRRLRQGALGRNPRSSNDPRRPGRSYWPEADAIRAATGQRSRDHGQRVTQDDVYPRSAFGMPIVFHFKDRDDPKDTQLFPVHGEDTLGRLASPLILRPHALPLRVGERAPSYQALALVLVHPAYDSVTLNGARVDTLLRGTLSAAEAARIRPLHTHDETFTDPRLRYLHLLRTGT